MPHDAAKGPYLEKQRRCFECGAYQYAAMSQDLDAPHKKFGQNVYQFLATSQDRATIS